MTSGARKKPGRARLRAVAACVPRDSRVVDVGSDHGLLPRMLLLDREARGCIATERQPGGVLARLAGRDPRLEVRFGDGLSALRVEDACDVIVIGGLGARSIIGILERGHERVAAASHLVLQPQSEWSLLRQFLLDNGFRLTEEKLVEERGRFYLVVVAEPGSAESWGADLSASRDLSRADMLEAGPLLVQSCQPVVLAYWRQRILRIERALAAATATSPRGLEAELDRARRILASLEARWASCATPDRLPE